MAKKYNWEVALEQTLSKTKAPKSETPVEEKKTPPRQFQAVKGSTMGKLNYDPSNPVHQELVSRTDLHDKVFITEEGPMVDTGTYRKLSHQMKMRRLRSK